LDQHIRLHHILRSAVIAVDRAGERRPALPTALLAPTPDLATSIVATSAQSVEPLLNLLCYAYGLRHLDLFSLHDQGTQPDTFQDLLCYQLAAEAQELLSRGLHRRYERRNELLASPRGRIDFMQLAGRAGTVQSSLPCIHRPHLQDTLIN
jgi:5-methylcytosine-specific restriction endonuclease McrBC regulatory subunit McrC